MKRHLAFIIFVLFTTSVFGQRNTEKHFGIGVIPSLQGWILILKAQPENAGYSKSHLKDSLNKSDKLKPSVGFHLWYSVSRNKNWTMQGGLQYMDMGFDRVKSDLKFLDEIHPEIGRVNDLAQGTQKDVIFRTRYQYVNVQYLLIRNIKIKTKNTDLEGLKFSFTFGASASVLLEHEVHAKLVGFTAYGQKDFHIKKTGYDPAPFNFNAIVGARFDYPLYPKTNLYVHPNLVLPFLNAGYANERHHLYGIGLEVGLSFSLQKSKKE